VMEGGREGGRAGGMSYLALKIKRVMLIPVNET
jgi:hypothetical protein